MSLLLSTDPHLLAHDPGHATRQIHPERPERLAAVIERLEQAALPDTSWRRAHAPASRAVLERLHSSAHVDRVLAAAGRTVQLDPDTGTSPASVDAALRAVGATIDAVEAVVGGEVERAFVLARPPGHHAERDRAMGFCLFSNLALGIEHARRALGIERVLVVDWDVHHGNGTQSLFYERDDVLVIDSHEHPQYPGTGAVDEVGRAQGAGHTLNLPLPRGTGDGDALALYSAVLPAVADRFRPQLVAVAAGFDAHVDDPLGGLSLTTAGFASLCALVRDVADRHAQGRMLMTLEGGYDLSALADSVLACARVLAAPTIEPALPGGAASREAAGLLAAVRARHGERWRIPTLDPTDGRGARSRTA
jgi:acetoin utilization deacetylase AcuC-like enzyme